MRGRVRPVSEASFGLTAPLVSQTSLTRTGPPEEYRARHTPRRGSNIRSKRTDPASSASSSLTCRRELSHLLIRHPEGQRKCGARRRDTDCRRTANHQFRVRHRHCQTKAYFARYPCQHTSSVAQPWGENLSGGGALSRPPSGSDGVCVLATRSRRAASATSGADVQSSARACWTMASWTPGGIWRHCRRVPTPRR